jgi:AcrR family transcriptional regulator
MARTTNADAVETRKRILEKAAGLFADHDIADISIRNVGAAANVNSAMIGHYFGSKSGLYEECLNQTFIELSRMGQFLEQELSSDKSLDEIFSYAVRTSFQFACAHRTSVRLLMRMAVSSGQLTAFGQKLLLETMDLVTKVAGKRLDRPADDLRLPLQSLVFLVARYAAQGQSELMLVVGNDAKSNADALTKVEDHLVAIALTLLSIPTEKKTKRGSR